MRLNLAATSRLAALAAVLAGFGASALLAPAAATAAEPPTPAPATAQRIELVRSGGFAGRTTRFVVDRATPGADAAKALAVAGLPEFRALAPGYEPADLCCDQFRYVATVAYSDGTTQTVTTWSHAPHPAVLSDAIRYTERGATAVPPADPAVAQRIDLTRSGGFVGAAKRFVVDRADADPDAEVVLKLAGSPEFRALDRVQQPARVCCDHFQYDLVVSYADGTTQSVRTWSNATAPKILFDVIRLTQTHGQSPPA